MQKPESINPLRLKTLNAQESLRAARADRDFTHSSDSRLRGYEAAIAMGMTSANVALKSAGVRVAQGEETMRPVLYPEAPNTNLPAQLNSNLAKH